MTSFDIFTKKKMYYNQNITLIKSLIIEINSNTLLLQYNL